LKSGNYVLPDVRFVDETEASQVLAAAGGAEGKLPYVVHFPLNESAVVKILIFSLPAFSFLALIFQP
jgi:hypothetical protein